MARRLEALPREAEIDLNRKLFNDAYYPYIKTINQYEVYYGGSGSGKCFAKGTDVLMFSGEIKKVEDVKAGEYVMGPDSKPRKVLGLSRGFGELYKVSQKAGMDYVVNGQHILCLKKAKGCRKTASSKERYSSWDDYTEISVSEYLKQSDRWKRNFHGYRTGIEFKHKPVLIDPYYLGVWLGDGNSHNMAITTEDIEIKNYIYNYAESIQQEVTVVSQKGNASNYLIKGYAHPNHIRDEWAKIVAQCPNVPHSGSMAISNICKKTGFSRKNIALWKTQKDFLDKVNHYKKEPAEYDLKIIADYLTQPNLRDMFYSYNLINNKYIPDQYLYNSKDVRLEVLAGIIDTDGYLSRNSYDIVQKNEVLSRQIQYLAHSVGLKCTLVSCEKTCANNGIKGIYWRLSITGNTYIIPVKIKRKQCTDNKRIMPTESAIQIESIGLGDYYGFEVDGDHKFLLGDFTVTHNSFFVAQKLAIQMTIYDGRNLVALRKQKGDCIKSCWGEIMNALRKFHLLKYWIVKENPEHRLINRINGNEILFEGLDDIEDIKSIKFEGSNRPEGSPGDSNVTDIWYEEANAESELDVIDELDGRLRDPVIKCRLLISFNPVSSSHFLYRYVNVILKQPGTDALILKTTYKDNHFLPKEYGEKLERLKFSNPYRYNVYCLGNWGTMGETVFDANKVQERLDELLKQYEERPFIQGMFVYETDDKGIPIVSTYRFHRDDVGPVKIYVEPDPKHPYVMSVDTAGDGSDFYVSQVCDNISGEQVAVFRDDSNPDMCVWQAIGLGFYYNDALIAPEVNFEKWIIKALKMVKYPKIYIRMSAADKKHVRKEQKLGFLTNSGNRQSMLVDMVHWTKDNMHLMNDVTTLNEMLMFTRQAKKMSGIYWGAEPGANDDTVMAFAIMLQARSQQQNSVQPEKRKLEGVWLRDELESAIELGTIDRSSAEEYIKNNGCFAEDYETRHTPKMKARASRYAR